MSVRGFVSFFVPVFVMCLASVCEAYTGYGSSESEISFEHWVELPGGVHTRAAARVAIDLQIQHLFGSMAMAEVRGASRNNAAKPEILSIEKRADGVWIARYSFEGTFVLEDGAGAEIKLALPNNPATIWQTTMDNKTTEKNPCTDGDYSGLGDFWYFWSPLRKGCRSIIKLGRDYSYVDGVRIKRIPNMRRSYPEYHNLPDENGRIQVTLIMGKDEPSRIRDPFNRAIRSKDENAENYKAIADRLEEMGFVGRTWTNDEVKAVVKTPLNPYPYVREFTYNYEQGGRVEELAVQMVYVTSAIDAQSNGFHYFLEYGLEKSAVTVYDGHSGLGGNIDLHSVRESVNRKFNFNLDKKRYQIYFFNSCSSYAYYNDVFFAKKRVDRSRDKKGSRYLDILTTGLETAFDGSAEANLVLINAIHQWAGGGGPISYQELAKTMEKDNLFGVNGDEDNEDPGS